MTTAIKTAEELMNEAEELQKKVAPDLFEDDGTSGDGASDDKSAADKPASDNEAAETEEEKKAREDAEAEAKKSVEVDYKAETERLNAEIKKLNDYESSARGRLQGTAEENRALKEKLESTIKELEALKTPQQKGDATTALTEQQLIDELGEVAGKAVYAANAKNVQLETMIQSLGSKIEGLSQDTAQTKQEKYFEGLAKDVKDWETINTDPEFLTFLSKPIDPRFKRTFRDELTDANRSLDTIGTVSVFQAFKDSKTAAAVNTDTTPLKKDKEKLRVPDGAKPGEKAEKTVKQYSNAEVEAMTKKVTELKAKGKYEAAKKIQADIDAYTDSIGG